MGGHKKIWAVGFLICAIAILFCVGSLFRQHVEQQLLPPEHRVTTMEIHYTGGSCLVDLTDQEAALELTERQPLMLHIRQNPGRFIITGVPDSYFTRTDGTSGKPVDGDFVLDMEHKELVVFVGNGPKLENMVLLGRVYDVIDETVPQTPEFDVFLQTAKKDKSSNK